MRGRRIVSSVFFVAIAFVVAASSCTLGESEDPGCRTDVECGGERVCRAGACFRIVDGTDAAFTEDDGG
jgi:hypothetical protein